MSYTPTIGLEIHAELSTKSKMFCGCKNSPHESVANSNICPVCTGQPGTLPVPNEDAIAAVLLFGRAVGSTAAVYSEFDRKNYFYPDIPKAYQISQYAFPFLSSGAINGVTLTRVHLEEDTARSQHDKGEGSLVDFNRAGVPLMELVTEPVIHDAATAGDFARELQLLLRTLGISEANMEKGEMRVEANISVSKDPDVLGTKVEVKNINSFKAVESAIDFEVARQIEVLESGGEVAPETRGWDENKSRTFSQRGKETAKDYRYFPDPDISKLLMTEIPEFSNTRLDEKMPILPNKKRDIYKNLGLPENQVQILISDIELGSFFDQVLVAARDQEDFAPLAANYTSTDVVALLKEDSYDLSNLKPELFAELILLIMADKISSRGAKELLPNLFGANESAEVLAASLSLLQLSDDSALLTVAEAVLAANPGPVADYKAGKEETIKFLIGQGMKESRGTANPQKLQQIMIELLSR